MDSRRGRSARLNGRRYEIKNAAVVDEYQKKEKINRKRIGKIENRCLCEFQIFFPSFHSIFVDAFLCFGDYSSPSLSPSPVRVKLPTVNESQISNGVDFFCSAKKSVVAGPGIMWVVTPGVIMLSDADDDPASDLLGAFCLLLTRGGGGGGEGEGDGWGGVVRRERRVCRFSLISLVDNLGTVVYGFKFDLFRSLYVLVIFI